MKEKSLQNALANCINKCNTCAIECIEMGDKAMSNCIKTDMVCAEVCSTLLQLVQYQYKNVKGLVNYCIEVCKACKKDCEQHDHDHCKACAKACQECITACNNYLDAL